MRKLQIHDPKDYLAILQNESDGHELNHLIDAISTNVTSFYRESQHFDYLSDLLKKDTSITKSYSALVGCCSTGAEPYTMAIIPQRGPTKLTS